MTQSRIPDVTEPSNPNSYAAVKAEFYRVASLFDLVTAGLDTVSDNIIQNTTDLPVIQN